MQCLNQGIYACCYYGHCNKQVNNKCLNSICNTFYGQFAQFLIIGAHCNNRTDNTTNNKRRQDNSNHYTLTNLFLHE